MYFPLEQITSCDVLISTTTLVNLLKVDNLLYSLLIRKHVQRNCSAISNFTKRDEPVLWASVLSSLKITDVHLFHIRIPPIKMIQSRITHPRGSSFVADLKSHILRSVKQLELYICLLGSYVRYESTYESINNKPTLPKGQSHVRWHDTYCASNRLVHL